MLEFVKIANNSLLLILHKELGFIGALIIETSTNRWVVIFTHSTFSQAGLEEILAKLNELNDEYKLAV